MEDVRRFYRQDCRVPCRFQFCGKSSTGEMIELSFDTALIRKPSAFPPLGAKIVLRVSPLSQDVVRGKVIYVQKQGSGLFGVKFSGTCEENLDQLRPLFERSTRVEEAEPILTCSG